MTVFSLKRNCGTTLGAVPADDKLLALDRRRTERRDHVIGDVGRNLDDRMPLENRDRADLLSFELRFIRNRADEITGADLQLRAGDLVGAIAPICCPSSFASFAIAPTRSPARIFSFVPPPT
jgi:hypothetical protein